MSGRSHGQVRSKASGSCVSVSRGPPRTCHLVGRHVGKLHLPSLQHHLVQVGRSPELKSRSLVGCWANRALDNTRACPLLADMDFPSENTMASVTWALGPDHHHFRLPVECTRSREEHSPGDLLRRISLSLCLLERPSSGSLSVSITCQETRPRARRESEFR